MDIVRNFINIIGITPDEKLPDRNNGQIVIYSDTETLNIPEDEPKIKDIYEIAIDVTAHSNRTVKTPLGKIVIVDGIKDIRIIYTGDNASNKVNIINLKIPYNTFFELPKELNDSFDVEIFIIDAYFQLLDDSKIYCHIVYLVNINLESKEFNFTKESLTNNVNINEELLITEEKVKTECNNLEVEMLVDIEAEYL